MKQTTKKDLIGMITNFLREHPEKEIYVPRQSVELKNGRFGMKAYCICYQEGDAYNDVFCRPWAGANCYWKARLDKLQKKDLQDIWGRCIMSTNPKY